MNCKDGLDLFIMGLIFVNLFGGIAIIVLVSKRIVGIEMGFQGLGSMLIGLALMPVYLTSGRKKKK